MNDKRCCDYNIRLIGNRKRRLKVIESLLKRRKVRTIKVTVSDERCVVGPIT